MLCSVIDRWTIYMRLAAMKISSSSLISCGALKFLLEVCILPYMLRRHYDQYFVLQITHDLSDRFSFVVRSLGYNIWNCFQCHLVTCDIRRLAVDNWLALRNHHEHFAVKHTKLFPATWSFVHHHLRTIREFVSKDEQYQDGFHPDVVRRTTDAPDRESVGVLILTLSQINICQSRLAIDYWSMRSRIYLFKNIARFIAESQCLVVILISFLYYTDIQQRYRRIKDVVSTFQSLLVIVKCLAVLFHSLVVVAKAIQTHINIRMIRRPFLLLDFMC